MPKTPPMNMKKQRLDRKITADDSEVDSQACAECWKNYHTATRRGG